MPEKTSAGDDAKSNSCAAERGENAVPIEIVLRIQHDRKRKAGALPVLPLDNEPVVISKQSVKNFQVPAPHASHRRKSLELLSSDGGADLQGADVIAWKDEAVCFEVIAAGSFKQG